jgi:hypothetical protein
MANTTVMRVNEVIMITMAGKKLKAVIKIKIWNVTEYCCAPAAVVVTVKAGKPFSAFAPPLNKIKINEKNRLTFSRLRSP